MKSIKRILTTVIILIGIGIVLFYFPNLMQQLFAFYIPIFGIITVAVILIAIFIQVRKARH